MSVACTSFRTVSQSATWKAQRCEQFTVIVSCCHAPNVSEFLLQYSRFHNARRSFSRPAPFEMYLPVLARNQDWCRRRKSQPTYGEELSIRMVIIEDKPLRIVSKSRSETISEFPGPRNLLSGSASFVGQRKLAICLKERVFFTRLILKSTLREIAVKIRYTNRGE